MARPERRSCDYFPFYAKDGRTLFILESKYGCKGTGFFTNVMRFLTLEEDHHFCIKDESDRLYFFSKCQCDIESGMDMLNLMAKTCKIDAFLWVSYEVIASQALLDSLTEAYRNRKNNIITMDGILKVYNNQIRVLKETVSCVGNPITSDENPQEPVINNVDNTQRKGKKRKVNNQQTTADFFKDKNNQYFNSIERSCKMLSNMEDIKGFNPFAFVNKHIKDKAHPGAVDYTLQQMVLYWEKINNPWKYSTNIMSKENGNFYERDHISDYEIVKKKLVEFLDNTPEIANLIGGIG